MNRQVIAVVGAGHAGGRVAQALIERSDDCAVVLIGDEKAAPYERPALSKGLLSGRESSDDLTLQPGDLWDGHPRLERVIGRADRLDPESKTLGLADGRQVSFDQLVVAIGGQPRKLPAAVAPDGKLHVLRTLDDCSSLQAAIRQGGHLAIVGAGVIGMEVAATARQMGLEVTVLDASPSVMRRCLPASVSSWLAGEHAQAGVNLRLGSQLQGIRQGEKGFVLEGKATGGEPLSLDADHVLLAIGIECQVDFLKAAGIPCDTGVVVDSFCRSPAYPWCYAVGDVAQTFSDFYGRQLRQETWRNAENQAVYVAEQILQGGDLPYVEIPWMWSDQFEHNIQVVGEVEGHDHSVLRGDLDGGEATLVLLDDSRIVGAVMINQGKERKVLEKLIAERRPVDVHRLADPGVKLKSL
ncbi:FAD-dependent oxidoreductase [Pseudomonas sp. BN515]|uniref:NAD(P)/FAD-dependent oxidoreductase n=1 Tax=Pseudomonas sp. BN515 TaxID=2567892 RepID=UPI002453F6DB|nr:FAD-dependent oxidoreductase [Pseudomonas sp. BN515]MDH4872015.1 benzene 1,2-dioxygenase [Pseudomonas sp. BN515]